MAAEVDSLPSPPLLASEREMSACQVDVRLDSGQAGQVTEGQRVGGYREMAQGGTVGDQELGIKLLMTSKVGINCHISSSIPGAEPVGYLHFLIRFIAELG